MTKIDEKSKLRIPNRNSLRNMRQYKNMSDEEFNELYQKVIIGVDKDTLLQERFDRIKAEYDNEYDLSELLPNDRATLDSLIQAQIQLEDFSSDLRQIRKEEGISSTNILLIRELNDACSKLRKDISSMQDDLKIARKTRKSEKEQSVLSFLEDLKKKASMFAHLKMSYIFCEKCGQLLATVWWQTDSKGNFISVECKHKLEDESICGWTKRFSTKELLEGRSNKPDLLPESMK
jgi:hypothetical protein